MAETSDLKTRFRQLQVTFAEEMPERLGAIRDGWRGLSELEDSSDRRADLVRRVHGIAGSAGSFGFPELGHAARHLEELFDGLRNPVGAMDPALVLAIDEQLAELVSFELAVAEMAEATTGTEAPATAQGDAASDDLVFLVEDDALLAEKVTAQLGVFGWNVEAFPDATQARAALNERRPVALIFDVALPEGESAGLELMESVGTDGDVAVPKIVISKRWDWNTRLAAVRAGAHAYLPKPLDFGLLAEQLEDLVGRVVDQPFRVLIVEDTTILAEHYAAVLKSAGMQVKITSDPTKLLSDLRDLTPELVLMDLYMPQCSGIEAARVIRQDPNLTSVPIVFLSTESGRRLQLTAMQTGADDFLSKPISDEDLIASVTSRARRFRALTGLIRVDGMTGLLNHISFKVQLETEIMRASRSGAPLTLAMLDVDLFKLVNDRHGHLAGDRVLKNLAQLLRGRLRRSDIAGRYGGEEFALILPGTPIESGVPVIEELRQRFSDMRHRSGERAFQCTFSAGVTGIPPSDDVAALIERADQALYRAKESGRNQTCVGGSDDVSSSARPLPSESDASSGRGQGV